MHTHQQANEINEVAIEANLLDVAFIKQTKKKNCCCSPVCEIN